MITRAIRWTAGALILVLSVLIFAWGFWPEPVLVRSLNLSGDLLKADPGPSQPSSAYSRQLTWRWPPRLRAGDTGLLRLDISPEAPDGQAQLNPESLYNVLVETRIELPQMQLAPQGQLAEPMLPGRRVTLFWSTRAGTPGEFHGTLWVYLRFIPKESGTGIGEVRRLLANQQFEIRVERLAGLAGEPARVLGGTGAALGLVLVSDGILSGLRRLLRRSGR